MEGLWEKAKGLGMIWHHVIGSWISRYEDRDFRAGWLEETGNRGKCRFEEPLLRAG